MVVVVVLGRERADDVAVAESECSLVAALEDMRSRASSPKCVWSLHLAAPLAEVMHACVLEMDAGQAVGRGWRLITDKRAARLCWWLAVLCAAAGSRAGARPRFS